MDEARKIRIRRDGKDLKDNILAIAANVNEPAEKLNLMREYIQAYILRSLHESEAFVNLSFVGGTALRFVFNLPRFSEDIDFSLENNLGYDPVNWMKKIKRDLSFAGFNVSMSWNDKTTVHKAWIKVKELLKDAGLATMKQQNLSIKLDIDTRPPKGAVCNRLVVTQHVLFSVQHHDLASLMAGKIHALVTRKHMKGRDWYDLLWYLGHRPQPEPNLKLLQNALDQTQGINTFKASDWKKHLIEKMKHLDCEKLAADVQPFLEHPADVSLITLKNFEAVLL